jgi:hypothetical protein
MQARAMESKAGNWVAKVQRFVRRREAGGQVPERCELCGAPIPSRHRHLVQPADHQLLCACQACGLLFGNRNDGRYRLVPEAIRVLDDFRLSDAEWDALGIPIGLAFFFFSTPQGRIVALYPGPAGSTESLLTLDAWSGIVSNNPVLAELEPDVEALLVNRMNGARQYYAAPIDRCYALVGLIRTHWRGIAGGDAAWQAIGGFFASLREPANSLGASRYG